MSITFLTTGATSYQYRPATVHETMPRLILRVAIEGVETHAMVDTGGVFLFCHPSLAGQIEFDESENLGSQTLLFRNERVRGTLHRLTLTVFAEAGEDLYLDTTAFVPDANYEGIPELPSILGFHGCLDRMRFAVDPTTDTFYFSPA